jgi:acyl dehydratase
MSRSPPLVPPDQRYFEDYHTGAVYSFGPIRVEESEVIAFASRYDPQPMHTDPVAAAAGPTGGLITSGWHTVGLLMRLYVLEYLSHVATLPSPGIDELRWLKPVRPGDDLMLRVTVVETRRSRSKPDRGMVFSFLEGLDAQGAPVATMKAMNLMFVRPEGDATA